MPTYVSKFALMVEVFKTNVTTHPQAKLLSEVLIQHFPDYRINFDLDDCDRILRVEGSDVTCSDIIELMNRLGCHCQALQ